MRITILNDDFDTIRTLPCFSKLAGHEVGIRDDQVQDTDVVTERLCEKEGLVLMRERTRIEASLLERLPKLKPARFQDDWKRQSALAIDL